MNCKHAKRMERFLNAGLYLVTSQPLSDGRTTVEIVRAALAGGVRLVQLREKEMPLSELLVLGRRIRKMTAQAGALLIINDRLDVAMALEADGVHLGQDDLPVNEAKRIAPDMIIGASSHSVKEAVLAQKLGASYVNIGPLFPTRTKSWNGKFLGLEGMRRISKHVRIPFTVMGGIKKSHIPGLVAVGATTIALVTAITQAADPRQAARDLLREIELTRCAS